MSEIKPALSAEEWAGPVVPGEPTVQRDGEYLHLYPQMDLLLVGKVDTNVAEATPLLQAVAALALHGQPFGFTWEDVDLLRELTRTCYQLSGERPGEGRVHAAQSAGVASLADRIAALLPPRET